MSKPRKTTPTLADRAAFEEAVNSVAKADIELRALTAAMDADIQAVRNRYAARIEALTTYRTNTKKLCEAYATAHADEVLKPGLRSGETALATYGFRLSPPQLTLLNKRHSWGSVIAAIRDRGAAWAARYLTQPEPKPNKDVLKASLTDVELASIGCRVEQRDTFDIVAKDDNTPET